jgi:hypothetical protein
MLSSPAPDKLEENVRFKDALGPFPSDISHWRDYYDWISSDKSTTFYNVSVVPRRCRRFHLSSEDNRLSLLILPLG